jgi:hypothetical protein
MEHSEFVKAISLKLFDELQPLHKITNKERELLEATSMLHVLATTFPTTSTTSIVIT